MAEKSRLCDQNHTYNRPQTPGTFEGIRGASEWRKLRGLRGGARSPERTMLRMADFPDKREFTGIFLDFDPKSRVFTLDHRLASMA